MAYASYQDLVARFGETEILRLATPDGQLDGEADLGRVQLAVNDATSVIESYIRRRYVTPLNPVPPEIRAACCTLARFNLAQGEGRLPTEQMKDGRAEAIKWLQGIARGEGALDAADPIAAASAFARTADRPALFDPRDPGGLL